MNKYETMFVIKADIGNEHKEALFKDIAGIITKHNGNIIAQQIWAEKKEFFFPINKHREGLYYLVQFEGDPAEIVKIKQIWKLNEDILRFQILRMDGKR